MARIFIVEDEPIYQKTIKYIVELNPDNEVHCFSSGKECVNNLHKRPDIITLDYFLPDMSGAEILKHIKSFDPEIYVIMLSGQTDVSTAVKLLKNGAYDYITKDNETKDRLINVINNIIANQQILRENRVLKEELGKRYDFSNALVGQSEAIKKVFSLMEKAIKTDIIVSIYGESGTGKEVVAKSIHYNSNRSKGPFVAVNMAAIPSELLESELFGHEKGAFTGANTRKIGKFELANGGTIFLDEISEMDISLQAKILRVIQEKELNRVGGNENIRINPRVVVATNKNLKEEVSKGNFREDLYYRFLGLPIQLPPLRERKNDIPILSKHFVSEFVKDNSLPNLKLTKDALDKLSSYHFPGNIRELKAVVELGCVMTSNEEITAQDIHFQNESEPMDWLKEELTLRDFEHKLIRHYLDKHDGNVLTVAAKLDIGKSTIYRLLQNKEI
ncbi:MAG: sigma-54-dependent transcriptional regulator [Bacteroidia bacterium]|jgi:DNA-binding NtrC family response regulator